MRPKDLVTPYHIDMLESINVASMLLLFLLGVAIAMLGQCFQAFMRPGQIFNWWALWLLKMVEKSKKKEIHPEYSPCFDNEEYYVNIKWHIRLIAYLSKPLGLCPYCNSTWISIIFFFILLKPSLTIFLLIGIVWFFVDLIEKAKNKPY